MNNYFLGYYNSIMNGSFSHLSYSFICAFVFMAVYFLINKILNKKIDDRFKRKKIKSSVRNILLVLLILILISLWAGQIKTMLLSTAAITAAVIITFKEIILSFFASFYITSNKILSIGDEVEYEGLKGKVVDRNFSGIKVQSTNIDENKVTFIPNIIFLTNKVMNFSKLETFKLSHIIIAFKNTEQTIEFTNLIEDKMPTIMSFNLDEYKNNLERNTDFSEFFNQERNFYIKKDVSNYLNTQVKVYFYAKREDKIKIEKEILNEVYIYLKGNSNEDKPI